MHAFVYDPTTGQAQRMRVDFSSYLKDLRQVYDLYKPDPEDEILVSEDIVTEKLNEESNIFSRAIQKIIGKF